jgi:hypothetical protein
MRVALAGLGFEVEPEDDLSHAERGRLSRLASAAPDPSAGGEGFSLRLVSAAPWAGGDPADYEDEAPASIEVEGDRLRVTHRRYLAELRPAARCGLLFRTDREGGAIEVVLRVALSTRLPATGRLPLHAAGVAAGGSGIVFFGPSGSGKSTLAAGSPHPVLSDELVAVAARPPAVAPTGFWGALGQGAAPAEPAPLRALVQLAKGPRFRLDPLPPREAFRRLLGVVLVPPMPGLWSQVLSTLAELVSAVPGYRMEWSPGAPPWDALAAALASGPGGAPARREPTA